MSADLAERPVETASGEIRKPPTSKELALEKARRAMYTGAAIRSDTLVVATVKGCSLEGFELCLDKSAQEAGINRLLLRGPPKSGKFTTGLAFKVEAVLQLLPGLQVEVVHFNRVDTWRRHSKGVAPEPIAGLVHWEREAHESAIATACFGEMHAAQMGTSAKSAGASRTSSER